MYAVYTDWRVRASNPGRNKKFSTSSKLSVPFWGPPGLLFSGYRRSFPGVNQPPCEVDHLLPPSAQVKNGWSYIPTSLVRPHGVDRDNSAFLHVSVRSIHICYVLYSTCIQFINIDVTGNGSVSTVIDVTGSGSASTVIDVTGSGSVSTVIDVTGSGSVSTVIDVTGNGSVSTVIDVTGSGSVSTVILFTSSDFCSHSYISSLLIEPTPGSFRCSYYRV